MVPILNKTLTFSKEVLIVCRHHRALVIQSGENWEIGSNYYQANSDRRQTLNCGPVEAAIYLLRSGEAVVVGRHIGHDGPLIRHGLVVDVCNTGRRGGDDG